MDKKNILFILVDQWPAFCFGHRGANILTPNIDRLADTGTVFTNAFTSVPLCSPARGTLLTSRWPSQTGMKDNPGGGFSLQEHLSIEESTWIDEAVDSGYHVGYYGKWHLGANGPILRGAHRHPDSVEENKVSYKSRDDDFSYNKIVKRYKGHNEFLITGKPPFYGTINKTKEETRPFLLANRAENFFDDYISEGVDKPFFLTISINDPHFPHYLPESFVQKFNNITDNIQLPANLEDSFINKPDFHKKSWWPSMDTEELSIEDWQEIISFAYMHRMLVDDAIGKILDSLESNKLMEDTIIIFTSDHGDMCGAHNRFDKGPYFYDEVWRIPLIIKTPDRPASIQNSFISLIDLGKTIFSLIGSNGNKDKPLMGKDIMPLVGKSGKLDCWPQEVYGMYDLYNGMIFNIRTIRTERYKYIWNPQDIDEFYDLENDPEELNNQINNVDVKEIKTNLKQKLFKWMDKVNDELPAKINKIPEAGTVLFTGEMGP